MSQAYQKLIKEITKQGGKIPCKQVINNEKEIIEECTIKWEDLKLAFSTLLNKSVDEPSTVMDDERIDNKYKFITTYQNDYRQMFVSQKIIGTEAHIIKNYMLELNKNSQQKNNNLPIFIGVISILLVSGLIFYKLARRK